jgi:hypothetical protein
MCLLFCSTPVVNRWLDIDLARAHRQSLQAMPVLGGGSAILDQTSPPHSAGLSANSSTKVAAMPKIVKRSAWIQVHCQSLAMAQTRATGKLADSPQDWHHALDAIANAWNRLLAFVRLR